MNLVEGDDGASAVLAVSCSDLGQGRAAGAPDGVGIRSMRERTEELGGCLEVGPGPDGVGTVVSAHLPPRPVAVPT